MIFACSDIHGNFEVYKQVINKISENDKLYIIGDVIDRGSDGIKILLDIMQRDNVEFIIGNHEWMMLISILSDWDGRFVSIWTHPSNKGLVTKEAFMQLDEDTQDKLVKFLCNCNAVVKIEENNKVYNLIHGIYDKRLDDLTDLRIRSIVNDYDDGDVYEGSLNFDILWDSPLKGSPTGDYKSEEYYVHGHVPILRVSGTLQPFKLKNMIFIDGGLQYGGGLILYNITEDTYEILK